MKNRKLILFLFIFGLVLFLAGIQTGKSIDEPKSETLGEKSNLSTPVPSQLLQNSEKPKELYKVLKVIDGDTVDIQFDSRRETVRLIGIDAPESGQCFGSESTNKARELLNSQLIEFEKDPSQGKRDKYGRLLGYIFLEDGTNFNDFMIRNGFAKEHTFRTTYKYQSLFKNAQLTAQQNKRGLWQNGACSSSIPEPKLSPQPSSSVQGTFTCDCSKLCSQIQTCDEAYFQLNQCGCSARDSDRDGVPCESLCK